MECRACGRTLRLTRRDTRGRQAEYCGDACRQWAHRQRRLPPDERRLRQPRRRRRRA